MKILQRYIIREHLGPFFFALAVIMFVFVTKFIVQHIGRLFGKGLPVSTIFEFVYLNLAWMMALAVPMSVLIAALMAFGRFSADNEITVLKSSGINLYRIITPSLVWATILTLLMIWYNDRVLPEFNHRARILARSISQKKPTFELEEGIYLKIKNINILVEEIDRPMANFESQNVDIVRPDYFPPGADRLKHITIFDYSNPQMQRTVVADYGYLVFDAQREQLIFNLFDGEIHEVDAKDYTEYRRLRFNKNVFNVEASEQVFKRAESGSRGDREMTIAMMDAEVLSYRKKIAETDSSLDREIAKLVPQPDSVANWLTEKSTMPEVPEMTYRRSGARAMRQIQATTQRMKNQQSNLDHYNRQIYKYQVEIYKKFSIPFACIVFVLIGAPLGIRARKGSLGVGVTFSVGFFLIYWACLIGGEELADRQMVHPALAMWFPNIVVGVFGLYLTIRTVRETTFIQWEKLPKFLQFFFKSNE
ncbi:MAG: LptF/LptG family permease [Calditrichia bacterium]|nr:LptF/LptG family permease [Calditrichota bacterium]MCB0270194.1 LptF/LptG family permease [Calditrichota bacterium]MCB9070026.1 LptF/LptG family permease [Calditrichia bacterium]